MSCCNIKYMEQELLPHEYDYAMRNMWPSSTFVSFYSIEKSDTPIDYLQTRVEQIVQANPWLLGRLIWAKKDGKTIGKLRYSNQVDLSTSQIFNVVNDDTICYENTTSEELLEQLQAYCVKKGRDVFDKDEILFKVTIVKHSNHTKFALVVSQSHVLGDGYTFYQLYGMLNPNTPIISLDATRNLEGIDELKTFAGKDVISFMSSAPFICRAIYSNFICPVKQERFAFKVNLSIINEIKGNFKENISQFDKNLQELIVNTKYITTTDIIMYLLFHCLDINIGLCVVNARNRIEKLTSQHAGNYTGLMLHRKDDIAHPAFIRHSMTTLARCITEGELPSTWEVLWDPHFAVFNSRIGIYEHVELPNCKLQFHFPTNVFASGIVLFKTNKEEIAIAGVLKAKDLEILEKQNWIGAPLFA